METRKMSRGWMATDEEKKISHRWTLMNTQIREKVAVHTPKADVQCTGRIGKPGEFP